MTADTNAAIDQLWREHVAAHNPTNLDLTPPLCFLCKERPSDPNFFTCYNCRPR